MKLINQADRYQEINQWSERSCMSSQVNYIAVNFILILDNQVTVWEWREESRWIVWKK